MKKQVVSGGFTLIELLVVVLIIGILAAVAVPQYQLAVTRSKFAKLKNLTKSLVKAQEIYYLSNNEYATDYSALDIQLPFQRTEGKYGYFENGRCWMNINGEGNENQIGCGDTSVQMTYQKHLLHSLGPWESCTVLGTTDKNCSTVSCKVCQLETGKTEADNSGTGTTGWTSWSY